MFVRWLGKNIWEREREREREREGETEISPLDFLRHWRALLSARLEREIDRRLSSTSLISRARHRENSQWTVIRFREASIIFSTCLYFQWISRSSSALARVNHRFSIRSGRKCSSQKDISRHVIFLFYRQRVKPNFKVGGK